MNKRQIEGEKAKLKDERKVLESLKEQYKQAAEDVQGKIHIHNNKIDFILNEYDELDDDMKSILQSQIYQQKFQKQIKAQLDTIIEKLNDNQYESIQEYLDDCYVTSFVGTAYDLHGQGIPLVLPIDQKAMVDAVTLDPKLSAKLYGSYMEQMKTNVAAEISRGIAMAEPFEHIARNISNRTNQSFNNTMRIVRTEGHGVQIRAAVNMQERAKEAGADVLKQWDATLDARTRDSHARLDGEIRELDEKFSNGMMYPSDPAGGAAEVINCRCALLQRVRWALDEEELEILKDRAEHFGLDKTDNFNDFKRKYLKASDDVAFAEKNLGSGLAKYTDEEVKKLAEQTSVIAKKHVSKESKWSGEVEISEDGRSGKKWNCDILIGRETAPHIMLHEQLHAQSISYYDLETYRQHHVIEEAAVQFMAQEISKIENIKIIKSQYDESVDVLRTLKKALNINDSDYNFAKELIEVPVVERVEWLAEKAYNHMMSGITIEEAQRISDLIDKLG